MYEIAVSSRHKFKVISSKIISTFYKVEHAPILIYFFMKLFLANSIYCISANQRLNCQIQITLNRLIENDTTLSL